MPERTAERCGCRARIEGLRLRLYVLFLNRLYVDEALHRLGLGLQLARHPVRASRRGTTVMTARLDGRQDRIND